VGSASTKLLGQDDMESHSRSEVAVGNWPIYCKSEQFLTGEQTASVVSVGREDMYSESEQLVTTVHSRSEDADGGILS